MVIMQPRPWVVDFSKLLNAAVKMKQFSVALSVFDEMRLWGAPGDEYAFTITINCYCLLKRVDFGFAIMSICFKSGYEHNVATYSPLSSKVFSR